MFETARWALLTLILLLATAADGLGQASWAVAERDDDQIKKLVANLQGYTDTLPGGKDAPALVLYRQVSADSQEKISKICVNMIVEVRDPDAVPEDLLAPYTWWTDGRLTARTSFVLRGDDVRRSGAGELTAGRATIGVNHIRFDWGDLRKGDVLGWSLISEEEGPIGSIVAPMAERVPMVISNVTTRGNKKYVYRARWYGMTPGELDIKETESHDSRPMLLRVSANQRPAVAERSLTPPFLSDEPRVVVTLDEVYFDSQQAMVRSGWVGTAGWNQFAASIAAALEDQATKAKGMDIALSAVTTGKSTAHAKAAAIHDYVRDKITLLEGPEFRASARREASEVFGAKEGTRSELVMLAAVMMQKSGVPVTIATFRDPAHGSLDESWGHFAQISEAVLRVEADDAVEYYAPQCAECEAGVLPAGWSGARALVWPADLLVSVRATNEAMMKKAMAAGTLDPAATQAEVEQKGWTRFETLP